MSASSQRHTHQLLAIFLLSATVLTLGVLALSAIVTNGVVRRGGPYYMLSRVLGPEFGGAVGVTWFVATTALTAFFLVGFSEVAIGRRGFRCAPFRCAIRVPSFAEWEGNKSRATLRVCCQDTLAGSTSSATGT